MTNTFHDVKVYGPDGEFKREITKKQLSERHAKLFRGSWNEERVIEHNGGRDEMGNIIKGGKPIRKRELMEHVPQFKAVYLVRRDGTQ